MWRRVLLVLVAYSAIVVVALAIPLALTVSRERLQRFSESRTAAVEFFADLAARAAMDPVDRDARESEVRTAAQRYHELYGEGVLVVDRHGAPRTVAGLDPHSADVSAAVSAALRNQRSSSLGSLTPWSQRTVLVAVPVGTGTQVDGAVLLQASTVSATRDVTRAWAVIVGGALVILLVGSVIAVALSRWTVRPLTVLALRVRALSDTLIRGLPKGAAADPAGAASGREKHLGPPEVRELSRAFGAMTTDVERAWESQRRLVADTSHSLRNPLAALRIRLETLGLGLSDSAAETHDRTIAEVDRLRDLVDGLLLLAAAESKPEDDVESCRVDAVIADRYDAWQDAMTDAGMTFEVVLRPDAASNGPPRDGPLIVMSERNLAQVLDVLLGNAAAYAGEGATVVIEREVRADGIAVRVQDTGRGVPEDEAHRMTDRFFRASTTSGRGSGLGLSIARALAEQAGGTLAVSVREPHGLCVELAVLREQGAVLS